MGRGRISNSLVVALIAMCACGPVPTRGAASPSASNSAVQSPTDRYRIATAEHDGPVLAAELGGLLSAQANADGTACTWVGSGSDRTALVWPPGYSAAGPPLGIYDEKGGIVALVGKPILIGGGHLSSPLQQGILGCHDIATAWAVGSVLNTVQ